MIFSQAVNRYCPNRLAEDDVALYGGTRDKVQRRTLLRAVVPAVRGFAGDQDLTGPARPCLAHENSESSVKQRQDRTVHEHSINADEQQHFRQMLRYLPRLALTFDDNELFEQRLRQIVRRARPTAAASATNEPA